MNSSAIYLSMFERRYSVFHQIFASRPWWLWSALSAGWYGRCFFAQSFLPGWARGQKVVGWVVFASSWSNVDVGAGCAAVVAGPAAYYAVWRGRARDSQLLLLAFEAGAVGGDNSAPSYPAEAYLGSHTQPPTFRPTHLGRWGASNTTGNSYFAEACCGWFDAGEHSLALFYSCEFR